MVRRNVRSRLHAHGLGRHSEAETTAMAVRAIDGLAQILGDNRYFMGSATCGADATLFAFVVCGLAPRFESPLRDSLAGKPNLVAYCDRMMKEFYPDFVSK